MQRIPVDSSDLVSIGYDPKTQLLEIEFRGDRLYRYEDVEPGVYERFMRADSFGQYFFTNINGRYRYRRIDEAGKPKPEGIVFVTGNAVKLRDMQAACQSHAINIGHLDLPVDEVQSYDAEEVAVKKAKQAYKLAGQPVVVNDAFWNIIALHGFPGAFAKYMDGWLKPEDFLKLLDGKTDRTVNCTDTLVYYDGKRTKVFAETVWGKIASEPKGTGKSLEQIVVISGETRTIAEVQAEENRSCTDPDNNVWNHFAKWYSLQRRIGRV